MKAKFINILLAISLIFGLLACNKTMGEPDSRLSEVAALIEPIDGKTIVLEPSASATAYFEWDYADVASGGTAIYQIAFDKMEGDFSNPVYLQSSDNNGFYNHVTISHKLLNKIAGMLGIGPSETGTFKWTVFSSKGTQAVKSAQENKITVTRLAGFADIPIDVYVTGEASEGGTDLSKAHKMKAVASGEFEVYTRLKAGQPYYFVDGITGTPKKFYTDGGIVKENGTSTVAADGIYRVTLDFNTGASTYIQVLGIGFYFSPTDEILFELPYVGNGIFRGNGTVTFKQEGWGRDERYKFMMSVLVDGNPAVYEWSTLNGTDSRPTSSSPASYYYLKLRESVTRWDDKWKLMGDFDGVPAVYTIYLQADQPYTHTIVKQ